jgi:hypothetical protein
LREASQDAEAAEWLSRQARINPVILAIGREARLRDRFSPECLARLGRLRPSAAQTDVVARIRELAETARRLNAPAPFISGLADIDNAYRPDPPAARAPRTRATRRPAAPLPEQFPEPPVTAVAGIEPILTRRDLEIEGHVMEHCVGGVGYAGKILRGRLYAYRVLAPERLTLTIRPARNGWNISELKGKRNREPAAASVELIRRWLRQAGLDT